jgi:hypothetical protein
MPPLLDWQLEFADMNAALSAAIKDMGNQLLLRRPAVFNNPFELSQSDADKKSSPAHHRRASQTDTCSETVSEDCWQPRNPWSEPSPTPSKLDRGCGDGVTPALASPTRAAREFERKAAEVAGSEAQDASDKIFACVQKRVVIATRELIADKMRRMQPPQWLSPCVSITGFVFKMCELETQRKLRKEFLQSDVRLQLYTIYTRCVSHLTYSTKSILNNFFCNSIVSDSRLRRWANLRMPL